MFCLIEYIYCKYKLLILLSFNVANNALHVAYPNQILTNEGMRTRYLFILNSFLNLKSNDS